MVPRPCIQNTIMLCSQVDVPNNKEFDPAEIFCDPTLKQVVEYAPEIQDQVRRAYILKGPTQPILKFPWTDVRAFLFF